MAVSYTHLDVYKRQILFCPARAKLCRAFPSELPNGWRRVAQTHAFRLCMWPFRARRMPRPAGGTFAGQGRPAIRQAAPALRPRH